MCFVIAVPNLINANIYEELYNSSRRHIFLHSSKYRVHLVVRVGQHNAFCWSYLDEKSKHILCCSSVWLRFMRCLSPSRNCGVCVWAFSPNALFVVSINSGSYVPLHSRYWTRIAQCLFMIIPNRTNNVKPRQWRFWLSVYFLFFIRLCLHYIFVCTHTLQTIAPPARAQHCDRSVNVARSIEKHINSTHEKNKMWTFAYRQTLGVNLFNHHDTGCARDAKSLCIHAAPRKFMSSRASSTSRSVRYANKPRSRATIPDTSIERELCLYGSSYTRATARWYGRVFAASHVSRVGLFIWSRWTECAFLNRRGTVAVKL